MREQNFSKTGFYSRPLISFFVCQEFTTCDNHIFACTFLPITSSEFPSQRLLAIHTFHKTKGLTVIWEHSTADNVYLAIFLVEKFLPLGLGLWATIYRKRHILKSFSFLLIGWHSLMATSSCQCSQPFWAVTVSQTQTSSNKQWYISITCKGTLH